MTLDLSQLVIVDFFVCYVNGKIKCRKLVNLNVGFPTSFLIIQLRHIFLYNLVYHF